MTPEGKIVASILKAIKALPEGWAVKVHQGKYKSGQPDIVACVKGHMFQFEAKVPGNKATVLQKKCLQEWRQAGAVAEVVYSDTDALAFIEKYFLSISDTPWV